MNYPGGLPVLIAVAILTPGPSHSFFTEGKPEWAKASHCSLFGDDHVRTFDGSFYDFAGDCSYLLAGDCVKRSFSLLGDYQHGKRKSISLYLGEYFDLHLFLDGSVTQGEKRMHTPYASNGIFLETEAGSYKLSSYEHGFVVRIDTSGNVQLMLSDKHFNKTCGLCGNMNNLAEDDFMTQEDIPVLNSYDFANSWALHEGNKRCRRVSPPSHTCNISSEAADKDVMDRCQLLKSSSAFLRCHHRVDPEPFLALCQDDMCRCAQEMSCHCPALLEYARTCVQRGVVVSGWSTDGACRFQCPAGMEYRECVSPCAQTCQSLNINEICSEQCVDGCSCPEGKFLDGDRCVDASECSCLHSGRRYHPGSSISRDCNTCICRHGLWVCSNEDCPGECFIAGQSHFKSFDNKYFTFSGICQYLLAKDTQDNSFAVTIETVQCADDPDAVCTRSASVRLLDVQNVIIKLKHGGGVSVDGQDIQLPLTQGALRIQRTVMSAVRLAYKDDLQIDWDGHGKLLLKVSPLYAGATCGLCGNYNGNQGDDFLTPSGLVEALVEDFGNSWKLTGDCADLVKQDADPCNLNPKRARYAEDACSLLMSPKFQPCHQEVNPSPYVKNCRYDVCSCTDGRECLCSAVSTYATACARKGVLIAWRDPDICSMSCSEGQIYQQCGTPCNQTCRSLSFPDADCSEFCMEGCYCPPGLYTDEHGECVPKSQCSCYYDGEVFQPDDVFSNHYTMCYCENGLMHCSANEVAGAYLPDSFFHQPSARVKRSLMCKPPMNKFVCPADNPRAEGIECARTCQNYDFECMSRACISGCMCPPGRVRHRDRCIAPEKCPCFHNGNAYPQGQEVKIDCNTCTCRNRKWNCTDNVCDGTCSVIGMAHYLTFDGLQYTFPGDCQYVLVQDYCSGVSGTFRVLIENEGCGFSEEKCSKRILILFGGGEIELFNAMVNIKKPLADESDFEVQSSGRYYILLLGKSISLAWDRAMSVSVTVKEMFRDQVCGLCGNFDGVQNNDLTGSNNQLEVDPHDFGNSWKVNFQCADASKFSAGSSVSACSSNVMKQMMVENACNLLIGDLFKECAKLVNPEPYWEICTYDTCACESIGDCACFCDSVAAFAHVCAQRGLSVHWRSSSLCPMSCEEKNQRRPDYLCEWRYNSCGPACPVTCQHPEPLECPLSCVEGCHAYCPPGKILDEASQTCIDPQECAVCIVEGRRIPHGKKIILNRDDPERCQSCHCEGNRLLCETCVIPATLLPTPAATELPLSPTPEEIDNVPSDKYYCSKMMDLAFLVDGSSKLSENEFETVKTFIVSMMEKLHISQKRIRVAVIQYHSGSHLYFAFQDHKKIDELIRIVQGMKYTGSQSALTNEGLKYAAHYVFGKAKRENAAKIAILLTASASPRSIKPILPLVAKHKVTVISVGLGPYISKEQINLITSQSPKNKAYILDNVYELLGQRDEIINYLCDLVPTESPVALRPATQRPTTTLTPGLKKKTAPHTFGRPNASVPTHLQPTTWTSSKVLDIVICFEGSDKVGEENFNKTKTFIENTIEKLDVREESIHITIIQYSYTVTVEYEFTETQSKENIIQRVRELQYRGGNATNTGQALKYISEHTFSTSTGSRDQVPHLVYMVTSNPASDIINKVSEDIDIVPIGVGQNVNTYELELISQRTPILIDDYDKLIKIPDLVLQTCCSSDHIPTTEKIMTTPETLPIMTVPCSKPMDIILILDGSSNIKAAQFEEMKTFAKAFIEKADIGNTTTQVAVLQYGRTNTLEISWIDPQEKESLLRAVDVIQKREDGPSKIGDALFFAVQNAMSEVHGGRANATKIAVIVVSDKSLDSVHTAAYTAGINRVSVFPIGVGNRYDEEELNLLAGHSPREKVIKLSRMEDLPTMVTLNNEFVNKLCTEFIRVCLDEEGNEKQPGDKWTLSDRCHSVTCLADGQTVLESHKVNCGKIPKPTCHNNLPAIKVEETCGCRWACPCMCLGSSTRHIVTFDGLDFKLIGNCSYVLFHDKEHNIEVTLLSGECSSAPKQNCMTSIDVKHNGKTIQLSEDMKVTVNGEEALVPFRDNIFEVTIYGAIMHEVRIPSLGFIFTFTPRNNEFTLQLNPKIFSSKTFGLCGFCDQNTVNDFMLRDGSVTRDSSKFIQEWTGKDPSGGICRTKLDDACTDPISAKCRLLLSPTFEECHKVIPPSSYFVACEDASCHGENICEIIAAYSHICRMQGVCTDWRSPEFCAIQCPSSFVYDHCSTTCTKHCGASASNGTACADSPTEGCFCPPGEVVFNGECTSEEVCSQCVDEEGIYHWRLDTWIPQNEPCKLCVCLDNKTINCTTKPCPTAKAAVCDQCEVARLKKSSDQCCPDYECVCDLITCDLPPVPNCENGLVPILTNPGECKPNYTCACKKEECKQEAMPACPPHRKLATRKTLCCDAYECACSCTNSTVSCPAGYLSVSVTNDCDCTWTNCIPDKVCVHQNIVYPIGSSWDHGCTTCTCTDMVDSITGLRISECLQKVCNKICPESAIYVQKEGECCGTCKQSVCEEKVIGKGQGDVDISRNFIRRHKVGSEWSSPFDPCIINVCTQVNDEVFIQEKNVSCPLPSSRKCPVGFELECLRNDCCLSCQCEPVPGCILNGTVIGPGETLMIDQCTNCQCSVERGGLVKFRLTCEKVTCQPCPKDYRVEKVRGSCCGKCVPTACAIKLKDGRILNLKPNETVQDGCDTHICKANARSEFTWEKRTTGCPPFNRERCLAEGGKIAQLNNTCCETCLESECRPTTGELKYIKIDDCMTEKQVHIQYCEGKCTSKAIYSIETGGVEDQCICCSATQTEPMKVPLRCANGSLVQHEILHAKQCECLSHACTK
ncbi:von Willebrand factor [Rhinatrema bivittatum]|uniref:von Willebrand factor n=1 Tax=Rhinatrema bivittatum TaxID=194408 RepID=UPI00112E9202|nr:von Willebrand factor [Rhinatrema bivittatum]XP_029453127.1 von Willebrand factor [Rhinatrema bivittatum]XP_029453128.1 von Willebrand factor [Rhinatrema bivittatum]